MTRTLRRQGGPRATRMSLPVATDFDEWAVGTF